MNRLERFSKNKTFKYKFSQVDFRVIKILASVFLLLPSFESKFLTRKFIDLNNDSNKRFGVEMQQNVFFARAEIVHDDCEDHQRNNIVIVCISDI